MFSKLYIFVEVSDVITRKNFEQCEDSTDGTLLLLLLFIFNANGFSPGGSDTTIKHNTQTIHITQNNTRIKRNTVHKITHTINTLHRKKIHNHNYNYIN
jgi:hypothetical protein